MLRNYFITAIRTLARQRLHLAINVLGLAVALAAALLVILYVRFEISYDEFQPNVESTYRMGFVALDVRQDPVAAYASVLAQRIAKSMPEVEDLFALFPWSPGKNDQAGEQVRIEDRQFRLDNHYSATPNIGDFVALRVIYGSLESALKASNQIALSRKEAMRLFGATEVIGRSLIRSRGTWIVAAVFEDLPRNTHYDFASLSSANGLPDNFRGFAYVRLKSNTDISRLRQRISDAVTARSFYAVEAGFHPLKGLHLARGPQSVVNICTALSLILIAIATLNFVNMSTAQAGPRAREIGVRKTLGASRAHLIKQYLLESIAVALTAGVFALLFVQLSLPGFNQLVNRELTASLLGEAGLVLLALTLLIGVLAGFYPALLLSSFAARRVLSGEMHSGDTGVFVRKTLFLVQAAFSAGLIVGTFALYQQVRHLQQLPTGYAKTERLEIRGIDSRRIFERPNTALTEELERIPGVRRATIFDRSLTEGPGSVIDIYFPRAPMVPVTSGFTAAGFDFIDTLGLELIAGRDFSPTFPGDWHHVDAQGVERASIVITRSMARDAGFVDPLEAVGKEFRLAIYGRPDLDFRVTVAGVVADVKVGSVRQDHRPTFFICGFSWTNYATFVLHLVNADLAHVRDEVQRVLKDRLGMHAQDVDIRLTEQQYEAIYRSESGQATLVGIFSALAILLSCVGTFGLAAFSAQRRQREFAIRRVHGASRIGLINLLTSEYVRLAALSVLLALPVTYIVVSNWLSQFSERIELSIGTYLLSAALLCGVTWLTISALAIRAANVRPSLSLRHE